MFCYLCKQFCTDQRIYSRGFLNPSNITKHYWCTSYQDARKAVIRSKYYGEVSHYRHILNFYSSEIIRFISEEEIDLIVPVPTQYRHVSRRGVDHTSVLVENLTHISGVRSTDSLLLPGRDFVQVESRRKDRIINPFYIVQSKIKAKNILLVDDVASTFSSLNACARALKHSSDARIISFSISCQNFLDQ